MSAAKSFYIGRTYDGDRYFATLSTSMSIGARQSIDHEQVDRVRRFSVTATIVGYRSNEVIATGQVHPLMYVFDGSGWAEDDIRRLDAFWRRWHLNDMRSRCRHQEDAGFDAPPCPVTGYVYGSEWLAEPITTEGLDEWRHLLTLPEGRIPEYV